MFTRVWLIDVAGMKLLAYPVMLSEDGMQVHVKVAPVTSAVRLIPVERLLHWLFESGLLVTCGTG
jgi:hypothetical protein